jgi:hypothetical protein
MLGLGIGAAVAVGAEVLNLALSGVKASKRSTEEIAARDQVWKNQFRVPAGPADNDPSNIYATVKVNGETVATIDNSGAVHAVHGTAQRIEDLPSMGKGEVRSGPALAQARAKEIAEALGGKIDKADTAMTQSAWDSRPPVQVTYDYEATERAMQARSISARTFFDAQSIGQST